MSQNLGTGACRNYLENITHTGGGGGDYIPSTNSILTALDLCLQNNYFKFGDKIYKQKRGVGTGIKLAPTYACIGVGKFEEILFSSEIPSRKNLILEEVHR